MAEADARTWYRVTFCDPRGHTHPDEASQRSCMLRTLAELQRVQTVDHGAGTGSGTA